jgi:uncharacterized protein (DUF2147 family)
MKKSVFLFTCFALLPVLGLASWSEARKTMMADLIIGNWKPSNGRSVISMYKGNAAAGENPNKYYGKIVWLLEPNGSDGKPRVDVNNPDANKRNNPIKGLVMVKDVEFVEEDGGILTWDNGTIYDPNNGSEYSFEAEIDKKNQNVLNGRGYIGVSLFGRTDTWARLVKK